VPLLKRRYGAAWPLDLEADGDVAVADLEASDESAVAAAIRFIVDHRDLMISVWQNNSPAPKPEVPSPQRIAIDEAVRYAS